ncbi:hypothetical protein [Nocardia spumae]|nr:hypothetical protein [Nocardia spumae]
MLDEPGRQRLGSRGVRQRTAWSRDGVVIPAAAPMARGIPSVPE